MIHTESCRTVRCPASALLLVASFWLAVLGAVPAVASERPDMVVFLADDLSQSDIVPYGGRGIRTPQIQRLAQEGLTFDRAYVASPSCAPSRAALLTGLMPARNGAEANHSRPRRDLMKWPAWFQQLGYEVVAFGKVSHYRHTSDYGFDHFAHDTFHDHAAIPAAVEFLKHRDAARAKPLCLMVGSNWPHVPWPETELGYDPAALSLPGGSVDTKATRDWRARYAAAVTKADDELGLVYDATLAHLGPQTLFVFSSDHGAQWPFAKWNGYEAGVRVPLIIAWPGTVRPGTRTAALVSWIDLLPTLLEAAGGTAPEGIDGRSLLPLLRGDTARHRDFIFTTHSGDGNWNVYPLRSVCNERWKYILNLHPEFAFTSHIDLPGNLGQRAYFATWEAAATSDPAAAEIVRRYHSRPVEELYDLTTDPEEQQNLAGDPQAAAVLHRLRAELEHWRQAQGDQRRVFGQPRLLSDPDSHGPTAPPGNVPRASR
jgi:arylsulfatase A-like enzyme